MPVGNCIQKKHQYCQEWAKTSDDFCNNVKHPSIKRIISYWWLAKLLTHRSYVSLPLSHWYVFQTLTGRRSRIMHCWVWHIKIPLRPMPRRASGIVLELPGVALSTTSQIWLTATSTPRHGVTTKLPWALSWLTPPLNTTTTALTNQVPASVYRWVAVRTSPRSRVCLPVVRWTWPTVVLHVSWGTPTIPGLSMMSLLSVATCRYITMGAIFSEIMISKWQNPELNWYIRHMM